MPQSLYYPYNPLLANMQAYWRLEEASGQRADSHGLNHLSPSASDPSNAAGKIGNAVDFVAASSQYLSIADNTFLSTGDVDFYMAGWAYFDAPSMGVAVSVLSKYGSAGNREYILQKGTGNRITFAVSNDGTAVVSQTASSFGVLSASTWYFFEGWHDSVSNLLGCAVNRTENTTAHSTGVFNSAANFYLGCRNGALEFMDGRLDDVLFIKGAIPNATARDFLYNSGNGRSWSEVAAYTA